MSKQGLILLNLGSPDSTEVNDVRNYLREFLMDERVLDAPKLIRWLIVHCFILPKRPRQSAEAYASIWKPEGSPLVLTSRAQQAALAMVDGVLIPRTDGFHGGSLENDWIVIKDAQDIVHPDLVLLSEHLFLMTH